MANKLLDILEIGLDECEVMEAAERQGRVPVLFLGTGEMVEVQRSAITHQWHLRFSCNPDIVLTYPRLSYLLLTGEALRHFVPTGPDVVIDRNHGLILTTPKVEDFLSSLWPSQVQILWVSDSDNPVDRRIREYAAKSRENFSKTPRVRCFDHIPFDVPSASGDPNVPDLKEGVGK